MAKIMNDYDMTKGLLNKIRKIQAMVAINKEEQLLKEQITGDEERFDEEPAIEKRPQTTMDMASSIDPLKAPTEGSSEEQEDIAVINDVEIEIHSEDPEDLVLQDLEKQKISQLIDDFKKDVSEIAEFDKLHVYPDSAKLDGKIGGVDIGFTLSTGEDTGLYISNPSMLKIDDSSLDVINKLRLFEPKFVNTINDLLVNRRAT